MRLSSNKTLKHGPVQFHYFIAELLIPAIRHRYPSQISTIKNLLSYSSFFSRLKELNITGILLISCHNCANRITNYSFPCTTCPYRTANKISNEFYLVLSESSTTQRFNFKKLVQLFQVAIHFHHSHPQLKTITDSSETLI